MPEHLGVACIPSRLPPRARSQAAPPQAEWLVVDGAGARRGNVLVGLAQRRCRRAFSPSPAPAVVLVPGADVLLGLRRPVLKLKSGAKLAQVVPFALEEQLAQTVEDMHFAVGKRESRQSTVS